MDYQEIIEKIKPDLDKVIEHLKGELKEIRTSRPSVSFVDSLEVDCFGKKFPLKSLGMISLSEKREIIIQPWDVSYLEPIEKAIFNSPLGLSPIIEENKIRISFPPLSEDLRKKMARLLSERADGSVKSIRHWRNSARKEVEDKFSEREIGEDDKFRARKELDKLIDQYNEKIDEMVEAKKKEIME